MNFFLDTWKLSCRCERTHVRESMWKIWRRLKCRVSKTWSSYYSLCVSSPYLSNISFLGNLVTRHFPRFIVSYYCSLAYRARPTGEWQLQIWTENQVDRTVCSHVLFKASGRVSQWLTFDLDNWTWLILQALRGKSCPTIISLILRIGFSSFKLIIANSYIDVFMCLE